MSPLPLHIPRWHMICALAQTGRTARQIADELQIGVITVYAACRRGRQALTVRARAKTAGHIRLQRYFDKRSQTASPYGIIPLTALRAAGLEHAQRVAFTAGPGWIRFSGEPVVPQDATSAIDKG